VEPLTRHLENENEIIKSCAALTLWQMGEKGIGAIVENVQREKIN
jgi:hypothetical protein